MKFQLTQEDIDKGTRKVAASCPVALCVKRALGATFVNAYGQDIIAFCEEGASTTCILLRKTPRPVLDFMIKFDDGAAVQPFEFELPDKA